MINGRTTWSLLSRLVWKLLFYCSAGISSSTSKMLDIISVVFSKLFNNYRITYDPSTPSTVQKLKLSITAPVRGWILIWILPFFWLRAMANLHNVTFTWSTKFSGVLNWLLLEHQTHDTIMPSYLQHSWRKLLKQTENTDKTLCFQNKISVAPKAK